MKFQVLLSGAAIAFFAAWDNLDLGVPGACEQIVEREGYALGYGERYEQPLWVSYHLTADEATNAVISRAGSFYADSAIKTGSATLGDYAGSGYDRGHLAPAADMRFATNVMRESFALSNVSPQLPSFNRGVWRRLEELVRRLAIGEHSVWIVTGPVFETNMPPRTIGPNKVRIPDAFYKVLCITSQPVRTMGFLIPHTVITNAPSAFATPISTIEDATGLCFFTNAPTGAK